MFITNALQILRHSELASKVQQMEEESSECSANCRVQKLERQHRELGLAKQGVSPNGTFSNLSGIWKHRVDQMAKTTLDVSEVWRLSALGSTGKPTLQRQADPHGVLHW